MATLYALTGALLPLRAALDACDTDPETGEALAPPDLLALLDGIEGDYAVKIDACARVIRSLEAEADMVAVEADRLDRRSKALLAQADRLSEAVRRSLVATRTHAVKGPGSLFTVSLRKGSQSVGVTARALVPAEFCRAPAAPPPEEWAVDKKAALPRLKAGEEIAGLVLVTGEPTLQIT